MRVTIWDDEKEAWLRNHPGRGGVTFQECATEIEAGRVLAIVRNSSANHPDQEMYILRIRDYVYCVPFVQTDTHIFLKTLFPSRRYKAQFMDRRQ